MLEQSIHPHSLSQYLLAKKHSQYNFKHFVFLQLHFRLLYIYYYYVLLLNPFS